MNMTTEQRQIAIAEFEGYSRKECPAGEIEWLGPSPERQYIGRFSPETIPSKLPPYLTSRDAICGAVGRLDDWRKKVFAYTLLSNLESWPEKPSFREGEPLCCEEWTAAEAIKIALATPAQMADALLLTLGYQI